MIGANTPARSVGFGGHLENEAGRHGAGWRGVVAAAAWAADELVPPFPQRAVLEPLVRQVIERDQRLGLDLDVAVNNYGVAAFDAGVLLGAALARTWPSAPDDLEAWPARALAEAGIPTAPETVPATAAGADDRLAERIADRLEDVIVSTLRAALADEAGR